MKNPKKEGVLLGRILQKIAPQIGATVVMEPEWGIAGQITFKNGSRSYVRYTSIDLNTLGASEIAKDKDYANYFLKRMGYRTIEGDAFFSPAWARAIGSKKSTAAAVKYAESLGYPLFVKPNSGSQGKDVAQVYSSKELRAALARVFELDRVALVQRPVVGDDYRIVVLDDSVISAYRRTPLSVEGDGRSTIRQLLARKQAHFREAGRDTVITITDPRIALKLRRSKLTLDSRPVRGEVVLLLDNANLSSGGESHDVTDELHPSVRDLAIRITRDMGLRLCGVDLMLQSPASEPLVEYSVLEINAAPGLDHYAASGEKQQKIVEELYLTVLKAIEYTTPYGKK